MDKRPDQRLADHERVIECRGDLSAPGIGISRDAELSQRGPYVEVGPLADHAFLFELKDDDQRKVDFAAGRGKTPPVPIVRSGKSALDDDCTVCVMNGLGMEAEVGKSLLVLIKERGHPGVAVPDLSCRDDLVARVAEGRDAAIEVVGVFGFHVLEDRRLTQLSQAGRHA